MVRLFCLVILFSTPVFAQEGGAAPEPSFMVQALPFLVMFFIFYFLMMRPQIKKQKSHQEFLEKLKKGDRVLTSGGMFGTIEGLTEKYATLEIAEGVSVRILKTQISQPVKEGK